MMMWPMARIFPFFGLIGLTIMGFFLWIFWFRFLGKPYHDHQEMAPGPDPLEVARERFARGEISQDEFDAIADRLIRTEKPLK